MSHVIILFNTSIQNSVKVLFFFFNNKIITLFFPSQPTLHGAFKRTKEKYYQGRFVQF